MKYLFIGGNADGEEIEVSDGVTALRVADKPVHSLSLSNDGPSKECIGFTQYTMRQAMEWNAWGSFAQGFFYFADVALTDEQALTRYLECAR